MAMWKGGRRVLQARGFIAFLAAFFMGLAAWGRFARDANPSLANAVPALGYHESPSAGNRPDWEGNGAGPQTSDNGRELTWAAVTQRRAAAPRPHPAMAQQPWTRRTERAPSHPPEPNDSRQRNWHDKPWPRAFMAFFIAFAISRRRRVAGRIARYSQDKLIREDTGRHRQWVSPLLSTRESRFLHNRVRASQATVQRRPACEMRVNQCPLRGHANGSAGDTAINMIGLEIAQERTDGSSGTP